VLNARGHRESVTARVLVNAAGPWVAQVTTAMLRLKTAAHVRLVKGSHIVVRRLYEHDRAYIFQSADGRVVFAIPYERDFTLIGTTDEDFDGDPAGVGATPQEIAYLCETVSGYFRGLVSPHDAVWIYAGVRPLYDDGSAKAKDLTRDYVLAWDRPYREAPLLTVYGGKITTYRKLAETALAGIARYFAAAPPWTRTQPLPGGDFPWDGIEALVARARGLWPFLTDAHARRMVHAYGTRLDRILGDARSLDDLGARFAGDLTAAEVRYLMREEWAQSADDVLWRRTKIGLHASREQTAVLERFMASDAGRKAAAE
jgi:glycerol-3-phosphate dehydrogenase